MLNRRPNQSPAEYADPWDYQPRTLSQRIADALADWDIGERWMLALVIVCALAMLPAVYGRCG
jgi:hypothetical protein